MLAARRPANPKKKGGREERIGSESGKPKEKKRKKDLGSGKPYDGGGEVEAALAIPALSNGRTRWRDGGEEEERI